MRFRGQPVLNWSLNNYIGLANHPEIRKADADAAADWGLGTPMGARMMSGNTKYHEQLEAELAVFVQKEDAILLNFGYQGIMSVIDAMLDRHDVLIYDLESHACIVDGARLHIGKRFGYAHNDVDNLEKQLQRATRLVGETGGGILVVTEGVFGMSSSVGKLKEIVALKQKYNFRLLVDDAHGFGTLGETGAGAGEAQGCQDGIDLYFSTFAKSMASIGAFIAGPKGHPLLPALQHPFADFRQGAAHAAGDRGPQAPRHAAHPSRAARKALDHRQRPAERPEGKGLQYRKSTIAGDARVHERQPDRGANLIRDLRENHHIFCSVVAYPVVPKGVVLMRLIPHGRAYARRREPDAGGL
jgi:glycine C-acetyltransferase